VQREGRRFRLLARTRREERRHPRPLALPCAVQRNPAGLVDKDGPVGANRRATFLQRPEKQKVSYYRVTSVDDGRRECRSESRLNKTRATRFSERDSRPEGNPDRRIVKSISVWRAR